MTVAELREQIENMNPDEALAVARDTILDALQEIEMQTSPMELDVTYTLDSTNSAGDVIDLGDHSIVVITVNAESIDSDGGDADTVSLTVIGNEEQVDNFNENALPVYNVAGAATFDLAAGDTIARRALCPRFIQFSWFWAANQGANAAAEISVNIRSLI